MVNFLRKDKTMFHFHTLPDDKLSAGSQNVKLIKIRTQIILY